MAMAPAFPAGRNFILVGGRNVKHPMTISIQLNKNKGYTMSIKRVYLENKSENHNKFYEMVENSDGTFVAKFGKIGTGGSTKLYSMREWDTTL